MLNEINNVALIAGYWTSIANESFLGVTCHTIDSSWVIHSFALTVFHTEERHYSDVCAQHLMEVIKQWYIDEKVTTINTDNARNIVGAVALLPFEHMPCVAHILQLSINKALSEASIQKLLAKCRK